MTGTFASPGRCELNSRNIGQDAPVHTPVKRTDIDAVIGGHRVAFQVKEMTAVGQKHGKSLVAFGSGHIDRNTASRRNPLNGDSAVGRGEHDRVVATPRSAAAAGDVAQGLRGAPADRDFFSLPPAKNPMKRLSGDQNGYVASSVRGSAAPRARSSPGATAAAFRSPWPR